MADALTTHEVERLARAALGRLYALAWPSRLPDELQGIVNNVRRNVDDAAGYLGELLLLLEFVDDVHHGRAVVVDQAADVEPDPPAEAARPLYSDECRDTRHTNCRYDHCACPCHTIPPHTRRHIR